MTFNYNHGCSVVAVGLLTIMPGLVCPSRASQPIFDVQSYGAKGNGVTDDTEAVQSAINAAHAAGSGTVYFPASAGCYRVRSLSLDSNLTYTGENASVCVKSISDNANIVTTSSESAFTNATISNLTLEGSGSVSNGAACMVLRGPTNVIIDHVTTTGCAGDGFYIAGYGTNAVNPGNGLLVTNSTATHAGRNGMSIITGINITVRNSTFEYSNRGAPSDGVDIEPNHAGQVVENVTFENCSFLNNGQSGSTGSGHHGFTVWAAFGALPNLNLRLIHDTFSGNLRDGLYAAGSGSRLTGIYVIGGTMSNNQAANGYRGGVDIWNANNVVVSNLTVTSPSQAVFLSGVSGAIIADCTLSGAVWDVSASGSSNVDVYTSTTLAHGRHAGSYAQPSGNAPAITTALLTNGKREIPYTDVMGATGTPVVTWTSVPATGNLVPPGMTLSSYGTLWGMPTASGTYTVTVQASNSITFDQKTFTVTVN
jgi:hypothetical protein